MLRTVGCVLHRSASRVIHRPELCDRFSSLLSRPLRSESFGQGECAEAFFSFPPEDRREGTRVSIHSGRRPYSFSFATHAFASNFSAPRWSLHSGAADAWPFHSEPSWWGLRAIALQCGRSVVVPFEQLSPAPPQHQSLRSQQRTTPSARHRALYFS
jgi:hypothetical protein